MAERWIAIAVLSLVVVAFTPSLTGGFVWDDHYLLGNNPALWDLRQLLMSDVWGPTRQGRSDLYRPVVMLSHYMVQHIYVGPILEKVLNLMLHICNVVVVAAIARRLGASYSASWFGAAVFGTHVGASEPVIWITGRHDLLPATLMLFGVWAMLDKRPIMAGLLLGLAPFGKEPFLLAPAGVIIWMIGTKRFYPSIIVLSGAGNLVYLLLRQALGHPLPAGAAMYEPVAAVGALAVRGLQLVCVPGSADALNPYVGAPVIGAVVLLAGAALILLSWGRPLLAAMLAPAFLMLPSAPASAHIGLIADRYYYLEFAGLGITSAVLFSSMLLSAWSQRLLATLPLFLALGTGARAFDWQNDERLWRASLLLHPDNAYASFHLAYELHTRQGKCSEAIPLYRAGLHVDARAGTNLLACLLELGNFQEVATLGPIIDGGNARSASSAVNVARANYQLNQLDEAERWVNLALSREPTRATAWLVRGQVMEKRERLEEALEAYEQAQHLAPSLLEATEGVARLRLRLTP